MNSIRRKLFFQIGLLMFLFILLLYIANTFFFETFYIENSKRNLIKIYEQINDLDESNYSSEILYQISVENPSSLDIIIFDTQNRIAYTSQNPIFDEMNNSLKPENPPKPPNMNFKATNTEIIDENSNYVWLTDRNSNIHLLSYEGFLDNGLKLNIIMPLSSIDQNIIIFNQYILVIGIIIFILSMIAANVISKHFTSPILNIFNVTNSIRKLDFSKTCEVLNNDELGRLADNINEMSISLKENIDELAESNENLQNEIDERIKIDDQRKALLNNVSHELKTPLSLVQGYSEGLKLNLHKNKEKTDFYCDVIIDESKKMDLLVSQLLDINRIEFGDFPLHKEITNGKDFLTYIVKKYEGLIKEENVIFKTNLELMDPSLMLNIDALRVEQVLTNLLNNALAYVDDRKKITLAVSNTINKSEHLCITVSNSHPQLPENELEKLWDSFYKIDKARTRENGGYGLGLSIIKAIQEADSNAYGVYQKNDMINFWIELDLSEKI